MKRWHAMLKVVSGSERHHTVVKVFKAAGLVYFLLDAMALAALRHLSDSLNESPTIINLVNHQYILQCVPPLGAIVQPSHM